MTAGLPPGPRQPTLLQTLRYALWPLALFDECARRFGDIFTLRIAGAGNVVVVWSPEDLRTLFAGDARTLHAGEANGLVFGPTLGHENVLMLDEEAHVRQRRVLAGPLHGQRMHAYADVMRTAAEGVVDTWAVGDTLSMHPQTQLITLRIILRAVFGLDTRSERSERLVGLLTRLANAAVMSPLSMIKALQFDWGPLSPWGRVMGVVRAAEDGLRAEIARRRAAPGGGDDVLSLLLAARHEDGGAMSDDEITSELMDLLVAGHNTTGVALAWALDRILAHPEVEARMRQEIAAAGGDYVSQRDGRSPLPYVDAVIKETLRTRHVMPNSSGRLLKADFDIHGYRLPAGTLLLNCNYLLHKRPDVYPDPDAFHPERFLGKAPNPFSWTPFGGGERRCVGQAFALYEMRIVLAVILTRVVLRRASPGTAVRRNGFFLKPARGLRVVVTRRVEDEPSNASGTAVVEDRAWPRRAAGSGDGKGGSCRD